MLLPLVASGATVTQLLRGGVAYHFSGNTNRVAAAVLGTYDIGAGAVNIIAPVGTGSRRFSVAFTPATDVTATFTINRTTTVGSTALRLTEGSVDLLGYLPGMKAVCQVSVSDPQQVLQWVLDGELPVSDYTVTLLEVGA